MNAVFDSPPLDKRHAVPCASPVGHIARIQGQLGTCVLLAIPPGAKGPRTPGWQKLRVADMTPAYLAGLNHGQNVGVSLGSASQGLCTIDADNDEYLEEFLKLNPEFRESLISHGARGGNVWLKIKGPYPPAGKLTLNGKPWGDPEAAFYACLIRDFEATFLPEGVPAPPSGSSKKPSSRWDARLLTGNARPRSREEHTAFLMAAFDSEDIFDFSNPSDVEEYKRVNLPIKRTQTKRPGREAPGYREGNN